MNTRNDLDFEVMDKYGRTFTVDFLCSHTENTLMAVTHEGLPIDTVSLPQMDAPLYKLICEGMKERAGKFWAAKSNHAKPVFELLHTSFNL